MCFATEQWEVLDELWHVKAKFSPKWKPSTTTEIFTVLQYLNGKSDPFVGNLCSEVKNYDNIRKKKTTHSSLGNSIGFCTIPP